MNKPVARFDLAHDARARFTTAEFSRMNDAGAFDDMKVELVYGELERMNASQTAHARWQMRIALRLFGVVGEEYVLGPVGIDLGEDTVLECDVAILNTSIVGNRWLKPSEILLVIEVSQTTKARDMGLKRLHYADAGIAHYWVVDAERSVIHIYGEPISGEYSAVHTVKFGDPLSVPDTDRTITID